MTLGIVVFGAAFLVGLGLGTYTRRPLSTAFLVLGSFTAGPTTIPIPNSLRENWKTNGAAVLVLENLTR